MKYPRQTKIDQDETHRLIPYRYSLRGKPILNRLAGDNDDLLSDLTELESATNDRLLGETGSLPGISVIELVSGFRLAHIVNATFTHAHPLGGRFNGPGRGAWYASFEMETAQREVSFHRSLELKEVGWKEKEVSPYIDYLADFRHEFHDIRKDTTFADCLDPNSYVVSQVLGLRLLETGSAGIVYPSVRRASGTCIACFRPPLVLNVRQGAMVTFTFVNTELASVKSDK
ncbi:MAG TPA: RES family NAD+ phosphorylase [Candidatus Sulfotelmatobacter sp.]|nr:RES family NAD+ phosphorylase [Candidatus Sulfotelmatobacter sp.]